MAKGNDGHFLQHCIEVEVASRLVKMDANGRLHIALTHGMAPFEPFDQPKPGIQRKIIKRALDASKEKPQGDESAIVKAYRKTNASCNHYPNSAELLRSVVGTDRISGGITEIGCEKHKALSEKWSGSNVRTACCSWRDQVVSDGILTCPDNLGMPWLFAMDPMTYSDNDRAPEMPSLFTADQAPPSGNGDADSGNLCRYDIDILSGVLTQYVKSGQPGIAVMFVYSVKPETRIQFWEFMDTLADEIGVKTCSFWLPHLGGNRNLAGLLYSGIDPFSNIQPCGLCIGRE